MKQNNYTCKKMALCCTIIILICACNNSFSQIIYTDIPDATPSVTYPLDLNNDNIADFLIQFDPGIQLMCKPQGSNAYSGNLSGGIYLPWALNSGVDICDSSITWYDSINPGTMAWGTSIGNWVGATDKYLALKLIAGSNTYYGWVRLDVWATSTSFTVKDYAYESTPNNCIVTGQTTTVIYENPTIQKPGIYPNPVNSTATITHNEGFKNATYTIYDSFQRRIYQQTNVTGKSILLDASTFSSGIYFLVITEENRIVASEIVAIIHSK